MKAESRLKVGLLGSPWAMTLAMAVVCVVFVLLMYHETFYFMVHTWRYSNSYEHCFLIIPISLYLIFSRKEFLAKQAPSPDFMPLLALVMLGFIWLVADLASVMVVQQYMATGMISVLLWVLLGRRAASKIAFPLIFLMFSVPFGDYFIPYLMIFTADFTVGMLKLTGIPVYRDGLYFSIPTGDWSVVEACSGIRYLIASLTLGSLFAYINYRSNLKRIVFIASALIVPIIANGIRAYLIVMIGHLSSMTLAVGVDHFIYGWLFFGLVMALMFWVGSKWSDPMLIDATNATVDSSNEEWRLGSLLMAGISVLLITSVWPMRAHYLEQAAASLPKIQLMVAAPQVKLPWRKVEPFTDWVPSYIGADAEQQAFYSDGQHNIVLFLRYYNREGQGHELISSENILTHKGMSSWKQPEENLVSIPMNGQKFMVRQGRLLSERHELLTWRWNWIAGNHISNEWLAKLSQAYNKLLGKPTDEAGIILAVEVTGSISEAKQAMLGFVSSNLPAIEQSLLNASALETHE